MSRGNEGVRRLRLIAFRENPARGGSPARLRKRTPVVPSFAGDIIFNMLTDFGEEVRLFRKIKRSGATMIIYLNR